MYRHTVKRIRKNNGFRFNRNKRKLLGRVPSIILSGAVPLLSNWLTGDLLLTLDVGTSNHTKNSSSTSIAPDRVFIYSSHYASELQF